MSNDEKVILEGYLGDWAQKSYFRNLAEKAGQSKITFYAVDIRPAPSPVGNYKKSVIFVDKKSENVKYKAINDVDYVFIVTPHEFHCLIAEHWLQKGKLSENGQIFIEKPLNSSVENILKLEKYKEAKDKIIAIDHYIPKVLPLIEKLEGTRKKCGKIKKIIFNILESDPILESRSKTLDEGLILDICPHILAIFTKIMNICNTFQLNADNFEVLTVNTAKYVSAPIAGETFARIVVKIEEVTLECHIGKAVGTKDNKVLEILFERGSVTADFVAGDFSLKIADENPIDGRLQKKHIGTLLDDIIDKEFNRDEFLKKSLNFDEGFEIVKIITKIRGSMGKPIEYEKSSSLNKILMKFKALEGL